MHLSFAASLLLLSLHAPRHHAFSSPTRLLIHSSSKNGGAQPLLLCHRPSGPPPLPITSALSSSTKGDDDGDGGDDWYDDYDDFVSKLDFEGGGWDSGADSPFEGSDDRGGGRGRYGRGGGGRGGGRSGGGRGGRGGGRDNLIHGYYSDKGGHDYRRDSRDDSEVDVNAVDELLASRLHYRKKRLFDAADDIRVSRLLGLSFVTLIVSRKKLCGLYCFHPTNFTLYITNIAKNVPHIASYIYRMSC